MKSDIPELPSMRPEPARDFKTGGYLLPDPRTGEVAVWDRATTLAGLHEDHGPLEKWGDRQVLAGLVAKPSLLDQVPELLAEIEAAEGWRAEKDAKKKLNQVANEAKDIAGSFDRSTWGTLLHNITEWSDAGRLDEVLPTIKGWGEKGESLLADLDAYRTAMADKGLVCPPEYIERILVNTACRSGGTTDRVVRLPDGRLVIGDLKTGDNFDFGVLKVAAQLAEYAYADALLSVDGRSLEPMPADLDRSMGLLIHLPLGEARCDLIELTDEDMALGWELAQHAARTLWFRSISRGVTGRPYTPRAASRCPECLDPREDPSPWCDCRSDEPPCRPPCKQNAHQPFECPKRGDQLTYLIRSASHPDALAALWRDQRAVWTDEHTREAAARKARLLAPTAS